MVREVSKIRCQTGSVGHHRGGQLALAAVDVGQSLDLINIMSHEAGWEEHHRLGLAGGATGRDRGALVQS